MDRYNLLMVQHQLLEEDIVAALAQIKGIDLRKALDIFYRSRLADGVENGIYGMDCHGPRYLARELIENEPELFEEEGK